MKRNLSEFLVAWVSSPQRKPLIMRGARQVGKTWLVRNLAAESGRNLVEVNFERRPELSKLFESRDPGQIVANLELILGTRVDADRGILFLDEVQEFPEIIACLRWFYEELPSLPVVAAGSLLEFALEEHDFSMPVGRVSYCDVEPMTFLEFLGAAEEGMLADYLRTLEAKDEMPDAIHSRLVELFRLYVIVGGMPAAVRAWKESGNVRGVGTVQQDLLASFRDDFNKYRKRVPADVLRKVLLSISQQLGGRFTYSSVDADARQPIVKSAVELLSLARLCTLVHHSSANGLPLGAEQDNRLFKALSLDIGLTMCQLGLAPIDSKELHSAMWSNKGAAAEQVVGQLLRASQAGQSASLFYWQKTGSSNAEIDYVIQRDAAVVPVEVKAGSSGSMKSLHLFMEAKRLSRAIRFDMNKSSVQAISVKTTQGRQVAYELESYPLYMAELI